MSRAGQPIPCGRLATVLISLDSTLAADWAGKGTFRKFVESLDIKPVEFNWNDSGGIAYDPARPAAKPLQQALIAADWSDKNLFKIAKQIHELTDVPLLPPEKYRNLITSIARDVAEAPFHLMETGKRVRDRCRETGLPVSRADVNHVLRGLSMHGHIFDEGPNDAATSAQKLANNVRSLCLREQFVLDEQADKAIKDWIGCK